MTAPQVDWPGEWIDRLRRFPRLGGAPWSDVLAAQLARQRPRAGTRETQRGLFSACAVLQVLQLQEELTCPTLLGPVLGPWTAVHLPPWLAVQVDSRVRGHLRDAAVDLDFQLLSGPVPDPNSIAEALVRLALVRMTARAATMAHLDLPPAVLARVLRIHDHPVQRLWVAGSERELADLALLVATGRWNLLPAHWGDSGQGPQRVARKAVLFDPRGPARRADLAPGAPLTATRWRDTRVGATAARTGSVRRSRSRMRHGCRGFVPTGGMDDTEELGRLMANRRAGPAVLKWQPVVNQPVRQTTVVLTGVEVDPEGDLLLLAVWESALIAVPVSAVVELVLEGCPVPASAEQS